ncbi:MAG: Asp23/Gls24 family envelope stress response protein [Clostridia bacterium]|nr:Asp23/Gls24 family envelope stress response protein [Clostridia bacterium]
MEVFAFVGASGTGKSHNSQNVAAEYNIDYIIDDALLIKQNKVISGKSAKTEPTKIGSVKAALFTDPSRAKIMQRVIKNEKIEKLLILGTSDGMVDKIVENLNLPEISKRIYIEEVSSAEQIEEAKRIRKEEGKHVVPVPTFEIKEQFSGYFMDPLKLFEKKDKVYKEKTVIRPTFSYLGNYTISDKVLKDIVMHEGKKQEGITKLIKVSIDKYVDGISIQMEVNVKFGVKIPEVSTKLRSIVAKMVDYMTGINIFSINVVVKGIDM